MKDVLTHIAELGITPTAWVVGSAPGVENEIKAINHNDWVVACNGAIRLQLRADAWAIWLKDSLEKAWWPPARPDVRHIVCGREFAMSCPFPVDYDFVYEPGLDWGGVPRAGILGGGASIAGCMVQLLIASGVCQCIVLVGIGLQGPVDYDGTSTGHKKKPWSQARKMAGLCRYAKSKGIVVCATRRTCFDKALGPVVK